MALITGLICLLPYAHANERMHTCRRLLWRCTHSFLECIRTVFLEGKREGRRRRRGRRLGSVPFLHRFRHG